MYQMVWHTMRTFTPVAREIDMEEEVLSFLRGFTVGASLSGVVTAAVIVSVL